VGGDEARGLEETDIFLGGIKGTAKGEPTTPRIKPALLSPQVTRVTKASSPNYGFYAPR